MATANSTYSFSLPKTLLGVSLVLGGTLSESRAKAIDPSINHQVMEEIRQSETHSHQPAQTDLSDSLRVVHGRVIDAEDKTEMPGVNVIIKGTKFGTVSNAKGEFELRVPDEINMANTVIVVVFVGYTTLEATLNGLSRPQPLLFTLFPDTKFLGEVVCIRKPTVWQRIKGAFRAK